MLFSWSRVIEYIQYITVARNWNKWWKCIYKLKQIVGYRQPWSSMSCHRRKTRTEPLNLPASKNKKSVLVYNNKIKYKNPSVLKNFFYFNSYVFENDLFQSLMLINDILMKLLL